MQEAKEKEGEERKRKEMEEIARIEREEGERKAREEAERQKIETAEKLRKEEKEREERRKRVEAIMSRTRKGGNPGNTPNKVCPVYFVPDCSTGTDFHFFGYFCFRMAVTPIK